MPIRRDHHLRDGHDVFVGDRVMKEIAHGIDENHFGVAPAERLRELFGHESQIETLLVGMTFNAAKALGERLSVAMFAARADLRAAAHRVPCGVCPFDRRIERHMVAPRISYFLKMSSTICSAVSFCDAKKR